MIKEWWDHDRLALEKENKRLKEKVVKLGAVLFDQAEKTAAAESRIKELEQQIADLIDKRL